MLRITVREAEDRWRIEAAGKIHGAWVAELEKAWHSVQARGEDLELDLQDVTGVDSAGRELLERMHRAGVCLRACGVMMTALVAEIAGASSRPRKSTASSAAPPGAPHRNV